MPSTIKLRKIILKDVETLRKLTHPSKEFHKYDGPYYGVDSEEEHNKKFDKLTQMLEDSKNVSARRHLIVESTTDKILGSVSWYWKSEETNWLEVGIDVFDESDWGKGIGYTALNLWINQIFAEKSEIVRIGLSTWSGNIGMMKLAEKLGLKQEACYRKARIVDGKYYDSVSYGILRDEWFDLKHEA
jgi:putative hydrolase of HD superfamily